MILDDVRVILSRASEPGNIGAVCRVMKNMGLSHLRLAATEINRNRDGTDIKKITVRAVHAVDIWENAQIYENLSDAIKDCSIVVGTTRRRGHNRKSISMTPRDLAGWLAERPGPAAIVFGNERTGLEDSEINLCNFASHIPVMDKPSLEFFSKKSSEVAATIQPSLNLSHAVQVYAYELFLAMETRDSSCSISDQVAVKGSWHPMQQERVTALVSEITDNLKEIGFYKQHGREQQERFLRDIISRAGLTEKEGRYLKNLLIKAGRLGDREQA